MKLEIQVLAYPGTKIWQVKLVNGIPTIYLLIIGSPTAIQIYTNN
jgi:hypothetical protein